MIADHRLVGRCALIAGCVAAMTSAAHSQQADSSTRRRTPAIAIMPITMPEWFNRAASVAVIFDSLLNTELTTAGYRVIGATQTAALQHRIVDSLGGLFDPRTGRRDTARTILVDRLVDERLHESLGAELKLYAGVIARPVNYDENNATWDHASEEIQHRGFLSQLLTPSSGMTPALSLSTTVSDFSGRVLHTRLGGIQLMYRRDGDRFIEVSKDSLLRNREIDRAAIRRSLDSLVSGPRPSP